IRVEIPAAAHDLETVGVSKVLPERSGTTGPVLLPTIPGLRLVSELGRGGMGIVYLAVRESDGTDVAVKTVLPAVRDNPKLVQRFLREAAVLRRVKHPRIVAFQEFGEHAGLLYFVMEYVRGVDLKRVLTERGPLDAKTALRIVCQMLEGLAFAHGLG